MYKRLLIFFFLNTTLLMQAMKKPSHDESLIKTGQLLQASLDRASGSIERLIEEGANPNYQDKQGKSVLLHAAETAAVCDNVIEWGYSLGVLTYLLKAKADPNLASDEKLTPLMALAMRSCYAISKNTVGHLNAAIILLVSHGARLDAKDCYGNTAFDIVSRFNDVRLDDIKRRLTVK